MIVRQGEIYLDESHFEALKDEPEYVRERYGAAAKTLAPEPFRTTRKKAAEMIKRSLRQLYRILKRFKEEGILGLRYRSKRPKTIPIKTSNEIEERVLAVRRATGFGSKPVSNIVNENLLTDNGSQFSRKNAEIRKYCEEFITGKHIWSSVHHPQTLGKLSAYQKGLKHFLRHKLGRSRNRALINKWIRMYNLWYNNGKFHSRIETYPEDRYSGQRDVNWFDKLVKALKLENIIYSNPQRGDISP